MYPSQELRRGARAALCLLTATGLALGQPPAEGDPAGETPADGPSGGTPAAVSSSEEAALRVAADEFLAALRRGHWGSNEPFPIDSFAGGLRLTPLGEAGSETGHVDADLKVLFRSPNRIRYELEESGRTLSRGIDADGPWEHDDKGTVALDSRLELDQARRALYGHLRSARILCELLDPSVAFARLEPTGPVTEERFRLGPIRFDAKRLTGRIERWPLWQPPEGSPPETPAIVDLYAQSIEDQDDQPADRLRLRVVVVRPLVRAAGAGDEALLVPGPRTETILLREPRPSSEGLQLPTEVYICEDSDADGPAKTVPQVLIKILEPILGEELDDSRFRRPR